MFKYFFNLEQRNKKAPNTLYLIITYDGKRIKINTGGKVMQGVWDKKQKRAIMSRNHNLLQQQNVIDTNAIINNWITKLQALEYNILQNSLNEDETVEELLLLKNEASKANKEKTQQKKKEKIAKESQIKTEKEQTAIATRAKRNKRHKWVQIMWEWQRNNNKHLSYSIGVKKLQAFFEIAENKKKFGDLEDFATTQGIKAFQNYLINTPLPNGNPPSVETVNKCIKVVKHMLCEVFVFERNELEKTKFDNIAVKKLKDNSDQKGNEIALTVEELWKIYNYQPKDKKEEIAKDNLLFLCCSGVRTSDKESMENKELMEFAQQKTQKRQKQIFIFNWIQEIIDKWAERNEKPYMDNRKSQLNKMMKQVAKNAGIVGKHLQIKHKAGEKRAIEIYVDRFDLIATHTGRRTFATMCWMMGMPKKEICEFTQHSEKQVEQYIKATNAERKQFQADVADGKIQLLPHDEIFFSGTPLQIAIQRKEDIIATYKENEKTQQQLENIQVLSFLGVEVEKYSNEELANNDLTHRLIVQREMELSQKYGVDTNIYQVFKEIFNDGTSLIARKNKMLNYLAEQKNKGIHNIEQLD